MHGLVERLLLMDWKPRKVVRFFFETGADFSVVCFFLDLRNKAYKSGTDD
jgi:hypothetical protein